MSPITLCIVADGARVEVQVDEGVTLGQLKAIVVSKGTSWESRSVHAELLGSIIHRGRKLGDDAKTLGESGIKNRDKLMVSVLSSETKDAMRVLREVDKEAQAFAMSAANGEPVHEVLVTKAMERLDAIELSAIPSGARDALRDIRKQELEQLQALETIPIQAMQ